MKTSAEFPTESLVFALGLGIPSLAIACLFSLMVASYLGPQFDVVIINDHVIGGTEDRVTWMLVASVFGAVGILCVLRFWRQLRDWRREREAQMNQLVPRKY
jgi:hypothetical protein